MGSSATCLTELNNAVVNDVFVIRRCGITGVVYHEGTRRVTKVTPKRVYFDRDYACKSDGILRPSRSDACSFVLEKAQS